MIRPLSSFVYASRQSSAVCAAFSRRKEAYEKDRQDDDFSHSALRNVSCYVLSFFAPAA